MHFPGLNLRLIQIMQRIYAFACVAFFLLCLFYLCIHLNCNFSAIQHSQPQWKMVSFHLTHEHPCPYYFPFNDISFHFKLKFHLICPKRNDVDYVKSQHVRNERTHACTSVVHSCDIPIINRFILLNIPSTLVARVCFISWNSQEKYFFGAFAIPILAGSCQCECYTQRTEVSEITYKICTLQTPTHRERDR